MAGASYCGGDSMTFRQLKYFSTIYECSSIAKASQKLYISQQGLSRILGALEAEVGVLFDRLHHGLDPTPLGTMLYDACQPVLREMSELEKAVSDFSQLVPKRIRIGLVGGTRYLNMINVRQMWQQRFQSKHPTTQFEAEELPYVQGLELFNENKVDMITYSDYEAPNDCTQIDLKTWERVLLVPEGHRLYHESRVSPQMLKGEYLLVYTNIHAQQSLLKYCEKNSCLPSDTVYLSDTLYLYDTCQRERCLGLTIDEYYTSSLLPQFPQLKAIPFTENFLPYTVSAMFRSDHPMAKVLAAISDELRVFLNPRIG